MGKSQPSAPPPPDPVLMANSQSAANINTAKATAALNRVNTYTPYGSLVYTAGPNPYAGADSPNSNSGSGTYPYAGGSSAGSGGAQSSGGGQGFGAGWSLGGNNTQLISPGGAAAQALGLPDPFKGVTDSILGNGNSSPLQDIRRAQSQGKTITDAQWAQAGLPPGGGAYGMGNTPGGGGSNNDMQYSATLSLSPEQQQLYNSATALQQGALNTGGRALQNVNDTISQPFSLDNLPALPGVGDFSGDRQKVENSLMSRYNTDFPKQQEDVISRLNAEGIQRGSEGYNNAMDTLGRQQNDARSQAIIGGGQEQSRLFGLAGQARQQALSEAQLKRSLPMSELASLLGMGNQVQQLPNMPNFGTNVAPTDIMGAYGLQQQGLQNNYNQQTASNNATTGAIGGLGSAALMALMLSDGRAKNLIRRVGTTAKGVSLWLYTFKGSHRPVVGVIAQEVMRLIPGAVHRSGDALLVDYAMVS